MIAFGKTCIGTRDSGVGNGPRYCSITRSSGPTRFVPLGMIRSTKKLRRLIM